MTRVEVDAGKTEKVPLEMVRTEPARRPLVTVKTTELSSSSSMVPNQVYETLEVNSMRSRTAMRSTLSKRFKVSFAGPAGETRERSTVP